MFYLLLLVSISLSCFICPQCEAVDPCPNATDLSPCTCSQKIVKRASSPSESINSVSLYTTIQCLSPKSLERLEEKVSTVLYRKWIDKLILSKIPPEKGYTYAKLPYFLWLENVRIRQLEIRDTQLTEDFVRNGNSLGYQMESLSWLKVSNCFLSGALTSHIAGTIQTFTLGHLHRLEYLDFSSNRLTAVQITAFEIPHSAPPNLTTLVLAKNDIQTIEDRSFQPLTKLKCIDLSHNRLKSVERSYFSPSPIFLKRIDLSWNSVQSLPGDFFLNMPALVSVNISYNFLFSLPGRPWSSVWQQLKHIDVSGNFIECNCDMLWLLSMRLSANSSSTVIGRCIQPLPEPSLEAVTHDLISLTRDKMCPSIQDSSKQDTGWWSGEGEDQ